MNAFRADIERYRMGSKQPAILTVFMNQGLWALAVHRFFYPLIRSENKLVCKVSKAFAIIATKWIEITTGIMLNPRTEIGPGLYIGHFGNIIVNANCKIGSNCVFMQGITLGNSGRVGEDPMNVPKLGDRVYISTNAIVIGNITLGDDSVVAAGAVLTKSLPPRAIAMGIPAKVVSYKGSFNYIEYVGMEKASAGWQAWHRFPHKPKKRQHPHLCQSLITPETQSIPLHRPPAALAVAIAPAPRPPARSGSRPSKRRHPGRAR